jgi:hypothetical protein
MNGLSRRLTCAEQAPNASCDSTGGDSIERETDAVRQERAGAGERRVLGPVRLKGGRRSMTLRVSGKNLEIGEALRQHVLEKVERWSLATSAAPSAATW